MSTILQASPKLCTLLGRLKAIWRDGWEIHRDFYIYDLLPRLQINPKETNLPAERRLLDELRKAATLEEWAQLPELLDDLEAQQAHVAQITRLERLLKAHQFDDADTLYKQIANDSAINYAELRGIYWQAYEVKDTLNQIQILLDNFHFTEAAALFAKIDSDKVHAEYKQMYSQAVTAYCNLAFAHLENLMRHSAFTEADVYYATVADYVHHLDYAALYQRYITQHRRKAMATLERHLSQYQFTQAENHFQLSRRFIDEKDYRAMLNRYAAQQRREEQQRELRTRLESLLQEGCFDEADMLADENRQLTRHEYLALKTPLVKAYFVQRHGITLNDEQAHVLALPPSTLLVTARAGSGKTRTLTSKAAMILAQQKYRPEQVLLLAFNKNAATKLRQTMEQAFEFSSFKAAFTFHSLAYHLVKHPRDRILTDEGGPHSRSRFVQELMWDLWDERFALAVYSYFRQESEKTLEEVEGGKTVNYKLPSPTLRGERVKSRGEKYIADFLFEHDITYAYERSYWWDGESYAPDFTIFVEERSYILEHWAIDPADQHATVPKDWGKSTQQYQSEILRKRDYWRQQKMVLIETSTADLRRGREPFEELLKAKLEQQGICCQRLSNEQVQSRMRESKSDALTRLFLQFIQRAKQQNISSPMLKDRLGYLVEDDRMKTFWRLALKIYGAYEKELVLKGYIDFEDMLNRAVERIEETKGACSIYLRGYHEPQFEVQMDKLQWLLVDEFQDLSPAFYRLLEVLRKYNPMLKIFGVGDDWQKINGFAGSDLYYFREFGSLFGTSTKAALLTNHRSGRSIVEVANHFMRGEGAPARAERDAMVGNVSINYLEDILLVLGNTEAKDDQFPDRQYRFADAGYDNGFYAAKTLKCCHQIASDCGMLGKSLAILNRTNTIYGIHLRDFEAKLRDLLPSGYQLAVRTVHSFKGQETDAVILLDVCNGSFPLVHSDSLLFLPFVRANENILGIAYAEEKRLFYVALTRAKERLWILTKKGRMSDFLTNLPITKNQRNVIYEQGSVEVDLDARHCSIVR